MQGSVKNIFNGSPFRRALPGVRRRVLLVFAVLCGVAVAHPQNNDELNQKITEAFKRVYGENVQMDFRQIPLDDSALVRVHALCGSHYGKSVSLHIAKINNKVAGYGIVDNVRGKEQPITYLVMTGTDLKVKDMEVLYYREAYGGEIQNQVWRDQFKGKAPGDNLYVGNGVQNISGATISTNAVSYGVRKLLAVFQVLRERNLL
jgi:Na+-translocating ferredoxin:NAD+ oxidoreductase RnfG subunit